MCRASFPDGQAEEISLKKTPGYAIMITSVMRCNPGVFVCPGRTQRMRKRQPEPGETVNGGIGGDDEDKVFPKTDVALAGGHVLHDDAGRQAGDLSCADSAPA